MVCGLEQIMAVPDCPDPGTSKCFCHSPSRWVPWISPDNNPRASRPCIPGTAALHQAYPGIGQDCPSSGDAGLLCAVGRRFLGIDCSKPYCHEPTVLEDERDSSCTLAGGESQNPNIFHDSPGEIAFVFCKPVSRMRTLSIASSDMNVVDSAMACVARSSSALFVDVRHQASPVSTALPLQ